MPQKSIHNPNTGHRWDNSPLIIGNDEIERQRSQILCIINNIVPTIVELIAPAGFQYYSFGRSMFDKGGKGNKSGTNLFGIGHQTIVAENFIANLKFDRNPAPLPDTGFVNNSELFNSLKKKHDQLLGLGWWLILRGEVLEASTVPD